MKVPLQLRLVVVAVAVVSENMVRGLKADRVRYPHGGPHGTDVGHVLPDALVLAAVGVPDLLDALGLKADEVLRQYAEVAGGRESAGVVAREGLHDQRAHGVQGVFGGGGHGVSDGAPSSDIHHVVTRISLAAFRPPSHAIDLGPDTRRIVIPS
jgi:hypothetical protein